MRNSSVVPTMPYAHKPFPRMRSVSARGFVTIAGHSNYSDILVMTAKAPNAGANADGQINTLMTWVVTSDPRPVLNHPTYGPVHSMNHHKATRTLEETGVAEGTIIQMKVIGLNHFLYLLTSATERVVVVWQVRHPTSPT